MSAKRLSLGELIATLEGYIPDRKVPLHLDLLTSIEDSRSAEYHFLLARLYERLAHHNHLADSPRTVARLLFHESINHYQRAAESAPQEYELYFQGKCSLLAFFLFSFPISERNDYREPGKLSNAHACFSVAARREGDPHLRSTLVWLKLFSLILIRRVEAENRLHGALESGRRLLPDRISDWRQLLERQQEAIADFEQKLGLETAKFDMTGMSKEQVEYLGAMRFMMKARLHEKVHRHLVSTYRTAARALPDLQILDDFVKENQKLILASSNKFLEMLRRLDFSILHVQLAADLARLEAEVQFDNCLRRFRDARRHDQKVDRELREASQTVLFKVSGDLLRVQEDGEPEEALCQAFQEHHRALSGKAKVGTLGNYAIVFDAKNRFHVQRAEDETLVSLATHAPMPFDYNGPRQLYEYSNLTRQTADAFYVAIRNTLEYLRNSSSLYGQLLEALRELPDRLKSPDLDSLEVTVERLHKKTIAGSSSLLDLLKDKVTYVWSLLEMFEMRKDSVRLGTLYSGECRLIMNNPHDPGATLEVGADPVFRLAIPLLFRGTRGSEEVERFLRLLLRSAINTAREQERCLKREIQFLEPGLDGSYRELNELYRCHEKLAEGLLLFVDPFVKQIWRLDETTLASGDKSLGVLHEALRSYSEAIRYPSPVVGEGSIEFFLSYVQGVLYGRRGMLFRKNQGAAALTQRWDAYYERAEGQLSDAKRLLERIDDSYLLVTGGRKEEFLAYLSARIATIIAWKLRYLYEDTRNIENARKAAEFFHIAEKHLDAIGDVPSATQALARAVETEALVQPEHDVKADDSLYRTLRRATSLYASCGDVPGFERTKRLIAELFPERESPASIPSLLPADESTVPDMSLVSKPEVSLAYERTCRELTSCLGQEDLHSGVGTETLVLLQRLMNFSWSQVNDPQVDFGVDEHKCRDLLRSLLTIPWGMAGEIEVRSGTGRIDLLINDIPIEVKRVTRKLTEATAKRFRLQLRRYVLSEGQKLGILVVFQFLGGKAEVPIFSDLVTCHGVKNDGKSESKETDRVARACLVQIVIPYFRQTPSRHTETG